LPLFRRSRMLSLPVVHRASLHRDVVAAVAVLRFCEDLDDLVGRQSVSPPEG